MPAAAFLEHLLGVPAPFDIPSGVDLFVEDDEFVDGSVEITTDPLERARRAPGSADPDGDGLGIPISVLGPEADGPRLVFRDDTSIVVEPESVFSERDRHMVPFADCVRRHIRLYSVTVGVGLEPGAERVRRACVGVIEADVQVATADVASGIF